MPEIIDETPLLFQSGGDTAPAAAPDTAADGTPESAATGAAPDTDTASGNAAAGTTVADAAPLAQGPGADASAPAPDTPATETPIDYGDFGFGEEAQIDRQSDDYLYYADLFRQIGLSPEQANRLLRGHRDYAMAQLSARQQQEAEALAAYRARVRQELVSECGGEAAFKRFGETALRGFRACAAGAGLSNADVDGIVAVMGDDPRFVKIFHHIGRMHQEDVLASGSGGGQEQSFDDMLRTMFHTNTKPQE